MASFNDALTRPHRRLLQHWHTADDRDRVLRFVQPGLIGLIDGTVSTLAPIFATALIADRPLREFVTPTEGDRIVKTMRTKGIGYADRVNVEAIQVTVTVSDDKGRFVGGIPRNAFRDLSPSICATRTRNSHPQ